MQVLWLSGHFTNSTC